VGENKEVNHQQSQESKSRHLNAQEAEEKNWKKDPRVKGKGDN